LIWSFPEEPGRGLPLAPQSPQAATITLRRPFHDLVQLRQRHSTGPRLGDESKQNFEFVDMTDINATLTRSSLEHPWSAPVRSRSVVPLARISAAAAHLSRRASGKVVAHHQGGGDQG
jgi:hypothetical protein